MKEWLNEGMNEWKNGWIKEINEWMEEWKDHNDEWIINKWMSE